MKREIKNHGPFELIGYHVDYFIDGKYQGSIKRDSPDRLEFGYNGRKHEIAEETIEIQKGRKTIKIKKGQKYYTELQALCGKTI